MLVSLADLGEDILEFGLIPVIVSTITAIVVTKKRRVYNLDNKVYFYNYQKLDNLNVCISHKINKVENLKSSVDTYKNSYYNSDGSDATKGALKIWSKGIVKDIKDLRDNELSLTIYIRQLSVIYQSLNHIVQNERLANKYKSLFYKASTELNNANKDVPNLYVNYYGNNERKGISDAGDISGRIFDNLVYSYKYIMQIQMIGITV